MGDTGAAGDTGAMGAARAMGAAEAIGVMGGTARHVAFLLRLEIYLNCTVSQVFLPIGMSKICLP